MRTAHVTSDSGLRTRNYGLFSRLPGVPAVVTYTTEVLDRNALRTTSFHYEELVEYGNDYKLAFDKVNLMMVRHQFRHPHQCQPSANLTMMMLNRQLAKIRA